jgi:hypothetical protein
VSLSVTDRLCRSGGLVTVKSTKLKLDPSEFVTVIGPVVEPAGTIAVIWMSESTVNEAAAVPLNETPLATLASLKPLPVTVTDVPGVPLVGLNSATRGIAAFATCMPVTERPSVTIRAAARLTHPPSRLLCRELQISGTNCPFMTELSGEGPDGSWGETAQNPWQKPGRDSPRMRDPTGSRPFRHQPITNAYGSR